MDKKKESWNLDYNRPINLKDMEIILEEVDKRETNKILNYGKEKLKSLLSFLWIFGTRINEALKMRRRHFDFKENRLVAGIPYSKRMDKRGKRHQESASLSTPLIDVLIDYLSSVKGDELVWGDEELQRNGYHRAYFAIRDIPLNRTAIDDFCFHQYRHTRATKLASIENLNPVKMKIFMGWKSLAPAQEYIEESEQSTKELGDKIGD